MEFIPKYIRRTEDKRESETITNQQWNELFNLLINQGDWNTEALAKLYEELKQYSNTEQIMQMINQKIVDINSADMAQGIYDTNSDGIVNKADTVVDGGIKTESIQDGAITAVKLEDVLKNRIDYCYSKVGLLLILVSAKNEITGSENLNLFGLDGTLETGYNIANDNINTLLNVEGYNSGDFTIKHYIQDASTILDTTKTYTLTNNSDLTNIQLSSITNAVLNYKVNTIYSLPYNINDATRYDREEIDHGYIIYIKDNLYYAFIDAIYEDDKDDSLDDRILVYPIEYDGNNITIGELITYYHGYIDSITAINGYVFMYYRDTAGDESDVIARHWCENNVHKHNEYYIDDRQTSDGAYRDYGFTYSSNGEIYYGSIDYEDDEIDLYRWQLNGNHNTLLTNDWGYTSTSALTISHISGRWGTVKLQKDSGVYDYYILDMHNGSLKLIEKDSDIYQNVYKANNNIRDTDGIHFYSSGYKYKIDDSGSAKIEVAKIDNFELINELADYDTSIIYNDTFAIRKNFSTNTICKIINNTCVELYDIPNLANHYSNEQEYCVGFKNASQGLHFENVPNDNLSFNIIGHEFTEGSLTLQTASEINLPGKVYLKRNQECTVNAGQTKQIYITPTVDNTFNTLNLIVYLNRALTEGDSVEVKINNQVITPIDASTDTTKYYELALETATSDFEIIITVKAVASQLQLTQILGGVDNAV
jgi:hypothetical protein